MANLVMLVVADKSFPQFKFLLSRYNFTLGKKCYQVISLQ